jgi:hypothetical protein
MWMKTRYYIVWTNICSRRGVKLTNWMEKFVSIGQFWAVINDNENTVRDFYFEMKLQIILEFLYFLIKRNKFHCHQVHARLKFAGSLSGSKNYFDNIVYNIIKFLRATWRFITNRHSISSGNILLGKHKYREESLKSSKILLKIKERSLKLLTCKSSLHL